MVEFGYAGRLLQIDLSSGRLDTLPTSEYASKFIGGRGVATKIYWDQAEPGVSALAPENLLIFAVGPLAGFPRLAGSRWQVCGKSPAVRQEFLSYANGGGNWGAGLKFAEFDGIILKGKSDRPVYILVHEGHAEIRDARFLWGCTTSEACRRIESELGSGVRTATIGPAGENLVRFSTLSTDDGASASGGFGAVMGSKNVKAIVVAGRKHPVAANPDRLKDLTDTAYNLRKNAWDIFRAPLPGKTKRLSCWGCPTGCGRAKYEASTGEEDKFFCQSGIFYGAFALAYYGKWNESIFHASRLCNEYGLNTNVMAPLIGWLDKCFKEGILSEKETGLPLSKIGSLEFVESLIRSISLKDDFPGKFLDQGPTRAAEMVGKNSDSLIRELIGTKADEDRVYDPRLYNIAALLYATEIRKPIRQLHEVIWPVVHWANWVRSKKRSFLTSDALREIARRFWGSEAAADFTSIEGVPVAAKTIQDRTYAEESLILCDYAWPINWVRNSPNHAGDPDLESRILSAVTGEEFDQQRLLRFGEKVFNLYRSVLVREGHRGRNDDTLLDFFFMNPLEAEPHLNRSMLVMGNGGKPVPRRGARLSKEDLEKMKTEYYRLREWDVKTGLPTAEKLSQLDLNDIILRSQPNAE